jgi:hypothetical protein
MSAPAGGPPEGSRAADSTAKWVYVAQAEHQANIEVQAAMPAPVKNEILCRRDVHHAGGKRGDGVGLAYLTAV